MKRVCLFLLVLIGLSAQSQDRFFAYTYTSNVLPKGNFDVELWHTSRFGHQSQFFHAMDQRAEFEVGLGKNLQTAFYFNRFQQTFSDKVNDIKMTSEIGFSNEWKWKLSDPSANKLGSALYGEVGVKGDEIELETKLILDKYFGNNLVAFNLVAEWEEEAAKQNGKYSFVHRETPVELDLAYMHNFNKSLGVGVELRDHNEIVKGAWEHSVLFGGPTINYRSDRFFVIANYLPQWVNLHKTAAAPNNKVLDKHERAEARIIFGFSF